MADDNNIAQCFTADAPITPSATMGALIAAFAPAVPGAAIPFDPTFPQLDGVITSSAQYELKLPAGVTVPPMAKPEARNILGFLEPFLKVMSTVLIVLGPIKVVIDIIIAIINVICAFPNPAKIAEAVIALLGAMLALAALFPVAAALVLLIQMLKTVIMILSAILLIIIPKIELIIRNFQQVFGTQQSNPSAAQGAMDKICAIVQDILNDLGILTPINAILSLIAAFGALKIGDICLAAPDDCCGDCPKIIRNPPEGRLMPLDVADDNTSFTVDLIDATYSSNIGGASALADVGAPIPFFREFDQALSLLNSIFAQPSDGEPLGSYVWDVDEYKDGIRVLIDRRLSSSSVATVVDSKRATIVYSTNHGLAVGHDLYFSRSSSSIASIQGFGRVVEVVSPSILIVEMDATATSTGTVSGSGLKTFGIHSIVSVARNHDNITLTLKNIAGASPPAGSDQINYRMIADEDKISSNSFMVRCRSNVQQAIADFQAETGPSPGGPSDGGKSPYFGPFADVIGIPPEDLGLSNIDAIKEAVQKRITDPGLPPDDIISLVQADIEKAKKVLETVMCSAISPTNSIFTASAQALDISSNQSITISFQPRSVGADGGQPIMAGMPPMIDINTIFTTTHGTLSEVSFNDQTGTYTATLTAASSGIAEVRAYFLTPDICSSPVQDAPRLGFPPKILEIRFVEGNLRPRRQGRQYLPSAGGRRR